MQTSRSKLLSSGLALILYLIIPGGSPANAQVAATAQPSAKSSRPAAKKRMASIPIQRRFDFAKKSTSRFKDPEDWAFRNVNELRLTTGRFQSPNGPEVGTPSQFQLLSYNGLAVGPTIRARRGSTFKIHLKNELKKDAPDVPPTSTKFDPNPKAEQPHDLCTTNLHTHGLHVSPADPSDNIFLCRGPGEAHTFEYTVPFDHPSGTFWYHPHNHGAVAYQLSNGVAGALIVEGAKNDGIHDLEDVPEIAAAKEHIFVFQLYNLRVRSVPIDPNKDQTDPLNQKPAADAVAWIDADSIYNIKVGSVRCGSIELPDADKNATNSIAYQATAINGEINPTITIAPGEVQRWRLIHSAWDQIRHLTVVDANDQPTDEISFHEIALDGLATGVIANKSEVVIAPGQRSDVLIQGPTLRPGEKERVYHLKQDGVSGPLAPHSSPQDPLYLATIVVTGPHRKMNLPDPREVAKCRPFRAIRDEELSTTAASKRTFVFAASDGAPNGPPNLPIPHYTINDKAFGAQDPVKLLLNTAEEWTLTAGESSHPFHIHVNAFQVVGYTDATGKTTPMDVWRDTLYINEYESYRIRSRFLDFPGKSVFHCHILDHEDQGMMMPLEFHDKGLDLPAQETCEHLKKNAPKLSASDAPTPALKLADAAGTNVDLSDYRGRKVVLVFFQGAECAHCAQALGEIVRDARGPAGPITEIVAVSSRRITDVNRTLKVLGVSDTDRFHLLVDEGYQTFRDFGCYDGGPKHGLFLIDGTGIVRAKYVGDTPYRDTRELNRRVRGLTLAGDKAASR